MRRLLFALTLTVLLVAGCNKPIREASGTPAGVARVAPAGVIAAR